MITYTIAIIEGHYNTPLLSISEIGAKQPASLVFIIVFTISHLLEAAITYIIYKLMELKTTDKELSNPNWRRILLALGWTSCIGSIIALYIQDKSVSDYMHTALFFVAGLNNIFQAIPFYEVSTDSTQNRATKIVISVSTITSNILEYVSLFGSIAEHMMLYCDFQLLTIKLPNNIKEDWIIIREELNNDDCKNNKEADPERNTT
ncbi:DNA damage-regulated autophagy modulator protein 1-like [Eleutherodactylus coqui]|uniref:DNA damage-regulated autophagy modulator protein 1-like n=1 Tax=Eleutherodactylus coqui TaxID=57060 RepID=UPI003462E096